MIDLTKSFSTMKRRMLLVHKIGPDMKTKEIAVERKIYLYKDNGFVDEDNNIITFNTITEDRLGYNLSTDRLTSSVQYKPVMNPTLGPNESQKIMSKKDVSSDPFGQYGEFSGTLNLNYSTKEFNAAIMIDILNKNNNIDWRIHWRGNTAIYNTDGTGVETMVCTTTDSLLKYRHENLYLITMIYNLSHHNKGSEDYYLIMNNKILDSENLIYLDPDNYDYLSVYDGNSHSRELGELNLKDVNNLSVIKQTKSISYVSDTIGHSPDKEEVD